MSHKRLIKILKIVTLLVGAIGILLYVILIPKMLNSDFLKLQKHATPWMVFIWGSAIPCYLALYEFWKITKRMEVEDSFSRNNALYLERIAILALIDTAYFLIGSLVFAMLNMSHPIMIMLSLIILVAGLGVGITATVLARLVEKAVEMKEENEFTI